VTAQGQSPSPDEIVSALEGTGFLLEHRAAQELIDAGFSVVINDAFPDPDTGKSREIDLFGGMDYEIDEVHLVIMATVLIECKNTPNPFVAVGTNSSRWDRLDESASIAFDPLNLDFGSHAKMSIFSELDLRRLPGNTQKETFVGHQLVRMNRRNGTWQADNSSVYDSILFPLFKARQHRITSNSAETNKKKHGLERWEYPLIDHIFPVLLTTGEVFTVAVNRDARPAVEKVEWTTLKRVFNPSDLRSSLRVDVVDFNHFQAYLSKRVSATVSHTYRTLKANKNLYDPEWLLANFGEPRHAQMFDAWLNAVRRKKPQ
jgi:hypothetical protein